MVCFERSIQVEPEWQCWSWFAYAYGARLQVGVRQPVCGVGDTMTVYAYGLRHGLVTTLRATLTAAATGKSLRFIWACVSGELIQNTNQNVTT